MEHFVEGWTGPVTYIESPDSPGTFHIYDEDGRDTGNFLLFDPSGITGPESK